MTERDDAIAADLDSPVESPVIRDGNVELGESQVERGIALALSGGGYRAMLFHVGALWRLKELQLLAAVKRVASVSGGSITAGVLALNWDRIERESSDTSRFVAHVVAPIRELAGETIDVSAVGWGMLNPLRTIGDEVAAYYRKYLFQDRTLQDLPAGDTRFIFTATSVQTGSLWRFSRPYMGDYRIGLYDAPDLDMGTVVAASSAFPPFLSPITVDLEPYDIRPGTEGEQFESPYNEQVVLTDGGVYDNLGLEPVWKRFDTLLVSDGGRTMAFDPEPASDWARHSRRLIDLLQSQVSRLRRRQLIDSFVRGRDKSMDQRDEMLQASGRWGVYWGIETNIDDYHAPDKLTAPVRRTSSIAAVDTRLAELDSATQELLINWGYAACDAAVRSANLATEIHEHPATFPYQRGI